MCAIAGGYNETEVEEMLSMMHHRGPDDSGVVLSGGFALGMARLKILDLFSSNLCPITDGKWVLVFNGELYNYIELKHELEKLGDTFNTDGDSEVLLKAYQRWGAASLDRFSFMGAFVISNGEELFMARDIAGEKPLYFSRSPFRFASEAKALNFDCEEFPPAHCATYDFTSREFDIKPWWKAPTDTRNIDLTQAVDELDTLLADAVRLRTRSHVRYGLYYSGGIDSTLISTYHQFDHKYTYRDEDYTAGDFKEVFPKILWHLDYPVKTFTPFGLWQLAQQARSQEVKVVLSGEGADELFGGYVRHIPNEFNRKARQLFPSYTALFPYRDMLTEEFNGNMRDLLRMGDRMAAAWGVENRCPFLDRRVIEFAMRLPMELKIQGYETKVILRELIKKRLPSYQFEEKKGLFCSVNKWLGVPEEGFGKETYWNYQKDLWKKLLK